MRALDIDMDFFLSGPCELAEIGKRPSGGEAQPWSEAEVRAFLEVNCGLSKEHPIPGAVFETHDTALSYWQEHCTFPMDVTHIDTHSDLGIGKPGPAFVLESVITRKPGSRGTINEYYEKKQLDEANYLLFAIAFRWVRSLENVRNPLSRPDMPAFCDDGKLQLVSSTGRILPALNHNEPIIPFTVYNDWREFRWDSSNPSGLSGQLPLHRGAMGYEETLSAYDQQCVVDARNRTTDGRPYDCATMAISPRYAPESADFIIDIFREYITE